MADYSTLLRDRVTLTVRSVDRIFLQGYVPRLQTPGWCARYLREQRGFGYPPPGRSARWGRRTRRRSGTSPRRTLSR